MDGIVERNGIRRLADQVMANRLPDELQGAAIAVKAEHMARAVEEFDAFVAAVRANPDAACSVILDLLTQERRIP